MEENRLFHDRYFLERLLGRGNFSEVWLAKDTKTDILVALKIYAPATGLDSHGLNVFAREFSLVVNANHKNLLKPLYYDSFDRKPYLVLPYCKKGSILKDVGNFSEEQAWRLLRDVASGLSWLHGMNPPVIHQDIKPDNVMIGENGDFMITDFGVSTHLRSTLRKSLSSAFSSAGTIAYMAPERFGKDNTPIMANDIYSLGATTYEMLTGDTPFGDDGGLVQKKGAEIPNLKGDYSEQLKKVIAKCLNTNPWERPTAEQLEEYAETALNGGRIQFLDERTSFQKYISYASEKLGVTKRVLPSIYKYGIVAGCVAMFVSVIVVIALIKHKKDAAMEQLTQQHEVEIMQQEVERVRKKVQELLTRANPLIQRGSDYDADYYENDLMSAYSYYEEAFSMAKPVVPSLADTVAQEMTVLGAQLDSASVRIRGQQREAIAENLPDSSRYRQRAEEIEKFRKEHSSFSNTKEQ